MTDTAKLAGTYVELHCHSAFSLLDGASTPELLVKRACELGYPALAITDHDEMGGVVRFATACKENGIGGIIGAELTVSVPLELRTLHTDLSSPTRRTHCTVLAETREGYHNLSQLVTHARMHSDRGKPVVPLALLVKRANGLTLLTGCTRGWIPRLLAAGKADDAWKAASFLREVFGEQLAIECWDHRLLEERVLVDQLQPLARKLQVPWVVTNNVHYATVEQRLIHDVLCALRHNKTLDEMGTRLRPNAEWALKAEALIRKRWQGAEEGIDATRVIADRCTFRLDDLQPSLPEAFQVPSGMNAEQYLEKLVYEGAVRRYGDTFTGKHHQQIQHELRMIGTMGFAGFFLTVVDIVNFARREGILCQGRGSAANSAVCYCLYITAVDPIGMTLLFERFLSGDRKEYPDIDIDFAHRERERVLQYVYTKYGREHAAMVCEHITWRGKSAVRDAARVLGFSVEQGDILSTFSDRFSAKTTAESLRVGEHGDAVILETPHETARDAGERTFNDRYREDHHGRNQIDSPAKIVEGLSAPMGTDTRPISSNHKETRGVMRHRAPGASLRPENWRDRLREQEMEKANENAKQNSRSNESINADSNQPVKERNNGQNARHDNGYFPENESHPERRNPTTATRAKLSGRELFAKAGLDPDDHRVRLLAEIVAGLHGLPRHRSIHVGGFILTAQPLGEVVPIEPASMPGRTVIQWEKDDLDGAKLVKIDLLGLGMLTVLQDCLAYIRHTRGVSIDLGQLEMTDSAVYDTMCAADTVGVFQIESRAQMSTLPRLKPRKFYDLVVEVALIRPGPIQGDMVHPYLRRRAGEEPVTYLHPSLKRILHRTMGVPLFQEQGMQVAVAAAGFTKLQADQLRRAMAHKRSHDSMLKIVDQLLDGMEKNGIDRAVAKQIYHQINAFADYGFPESHAASFALIVYASAYLRYYYAAEFTAAILNAQPMGFYSPSSLIEDARRHNVRVLPIDLTCSRWDHSLELPTGHRLIPRDGKIQWDDSDAWFMHEGEPMLRDRPAYANDETVAQPNQPAPPAVRLGVRLVRGLGSNARAALEAALVDGPFTTINNFVQRVPLNKRALRALAESGAFDSMFQHEPPERRRRVALWELLAASRGELPLAPAHHSRVPASLIPLKPVELTEVDYRTTGLSLTAHPMVHLRETLRLNDVKTAQFLREKGQHGKRVATAGLVICRQRPGTAKGFVFLTLEDETGMLNIIIPPKRFDADALLISTSPLLLIRGVLQVVQGVVNLKAETFRALQAESGEEYVKGRNFH
jgi:error-prone DNA polymerase